MLKIDLKVDIPGRPLPMMTGILSCLLLEIAVFLQDRFRGRYQKDVSVQTNRLYAANLRARKAAQKPAMTALQHVRRLRCCHQHRPWNLRRWRHIVFSDDDDESCFCLRKFDGREKFGGDVENGLLSIDTSYSIWR